MTVWGWAWWRRRKRRAELAALAQEAEQAATEATRQWPAVHRAADTFAQQLTRAMGKRRHP